MAYAMLNLVPRLCVLLLLASVGADHHAQYQLTVHAEQIASHLEPPPVGEDVQRHTSATLRGAPSQVTRREAAGDVVIVYADDGSDLESAEQGGSEMSSEQSSEKGATSNFRFLQEQEHNATLQQHRNSTESSEELEGSSTEKPGPGMENSTQEPNKQKEASTPVSVSKPENPTESPAAENHSSAVRPTKRPFDNSGGILSSILRQLGGTISRISQYDWVSLWNNQTANMIMRDDRNQSKCFDNIGCVNYTLTWYHSVHRPINFFPLERNVVNVKFWVHTRAKPFQNISLSVEQPDSVAATGFSPLKNTKFIIHGFLDTGTDDWVKEMAQRLLDAEDCNVVAVDWRFGALPMYQQALSNTQLVAMETAHLIKWLQREHGLDVARLHLIGHSLGAQTAGYIGSRVPGIARISGLDPAEPGFQYMDPAVRLDEADAKLVDVIHSDGRSFYRSGLGMYQACGHLDFYPNGGEDQPGCSSYSSTLNVLLNSGVDDFEAELFACRHVRAIRFFTDSIARNPSCDFIAHECTGYEEFLKGECGECGPEDLHCASMGYHADRYRHKHRVNVPLYLTTTERSPFCLRHYRVTLRLADPEGRQKKVTGHLLVSIYGENDKLEKYRVPEQGTLDLEHGSEVSFLVKTPVDLGPAQRLVVWWHEGSQGILPLPCILWCDDGSLLLRQATLLDMDRPRSDSSTLQKFCSSDPEGFARLAPSGSPRTFYNREECLPVKTTETPVRPSLFSQLPNPLSDGPPLLSQLPNPLSAFSGRRRKYRFHQLPTGGPDNRRRGVSPEPLNRPKWLWSIFD